MIRLEEAKETMIVSCIGHIRNGQSPAALREIGFAEGCIIEARRRIEAGEFEDEPHGLVYADGFWIRIE